MKEDLRKRTKSVSRELERRYGKKRWRVHNDPLSELIATILSQNTSDHNSHMAYANLRSRFGTWKKVRGARVKSIAEAIRSGGLADIKAQRIKDILNRIYRENHNLDLTYLRGWKTEEIKAYLRNFKGVGDKTVACVLLFSLKRPVMPVDTHVLRVSKRLGLVPKKANASRAEAILEELVPQNQFYGFHLNLIRHGRTVCKAATPQCESCVLLADCNYGKTAVGKSKRVQVA